MTDDRMKALDAIDAVLTKYGIGTRAGMLARDILAALDALPKPPASVTARIAHLCSFAKCNRLANVWTGNAWWCSRHAPASGDVLAAQRRAREGGTP